jgi:hypothetical protein
MNATWHRTIAYRDTLIKLLVNKEKNQETD